jgi:hypothetical protein
MTPKATIVAAGKTEKMPPMSSPAVMTKYALAATMIPPKRA